MIVSLALLVGVPNVPTVRAAGSSIAFDVRIDFTTYTSSSVPSPNQGIDLPVTLEAKVIDNGNPVATPVGFQILDGPNGGRRAAVTSDANGNAAYSYTSAATGTDRVDAVFSDSSDNLIESAEISIRWVDQAAVSLCVLVTVPLCYGVPQNAPGGARVTLVGNVFDTCGVCVGYGRPVSFSILSGPDSGQHLGAPSVAPGQAQAYFTNRLPGTDMIQASFRDNLGRTQLSAVVALTWTGASQTISFPRPPDGRIGGRPALLAATATSGLPVSYTSGSPGVCSISGTSAVLQSAGTCSVTAHQLGGPTFYAAPDASVSFAVTGRSTLTYEAVAGNVGTAAAAVALLSKLRLAGWKGYRLESERHGTARYQVERPFTTMAAARAEVIKLRKTSNRGALETDLPGSV